jgi:palmitoyl-protein thioesterase
MRDVLSLFVALPALYVAAAASVRPLVLWHGMGDSAFSPGMLEFAELIKDIHPDIFVHSVYLAEDNQSDQRAGIVRRFCFSPRYPDMLIKSGSPSG